MLRRGERKRREGCEESRCLDDIAETAETEEPHGLDGGMHHERAGDDAADIIHALCCFVS